MIYGSIWGRAVLVGTCWHWVSMEWYWLIFDGTESVKAGSDLYMMLLGQ